MKSKDPLKLADFRQLLLYLQESVKKCESKLKSSNELRNRAVGAVIFSAIQHNL